MPDKFGLPVGEEALRVPRGVTKAGKLAASIVLKIARKYGPKPIDMGGCSLFVTPKSWYKDQDMDGPPPDLVVLFEGGDLHEVFSYHYDSAAREELRLELGKVNLWFEDFANYAFCIYRMKGYKDAEPNTNSAVDRKLRRYDLDCSFCPPNRGENARRKQKDDSYKSTRRGRK